MAKQKMKICKACGKEIAKSASQCPFCGAKQKSVSCLAVVLIVVAIFVAVGVIVAVAGGGNNEPKLVGNSGTSDASSASSEITKTEFDVGETVELNGVVVTMTSVTESTGVDFYTPEDGNVFLICEFEIENNSDRDVGVSSIMSFNAFVDDYAQNLSLSAVMASGKDQLDGTAAPGKKVGGVMGYEVSADWKELEIQFTPDFWSGKEIVFVHNK